MPRKSKKWEGVLGDDKAFVVKVKDLDAYFDELFKHYELQDIEASKDDIYKFLIFEMAKDLKIPAFISFAKQEERKKKDIGDFVFYRDIIAKINVATIIKKIHNVDLRSRHSVSVSKAIEEYVNENNLRIEYATLEKRFRRIKARNPIVRFFYNEEVILAAMNKFDKPTREYMNILADITIARSVKKLTPENLMSDNKLFQKIDSHLLTEILQNN